MTHNQKFLYLLLLTLFQILNSLATTPADALKSNAGMLPWTIHEGKLWILLGKEQRQRAGLVWTDFGGKCERGENVADCAAREGSEELRELYTQQELKQKIKDGPIILLDDYAQCFPHIKWITLVDLNTLAQSKKGTWWEKTGFLWVKYSDIDQAIKTAKATFKERWKEHVLIFEGHNNIRLYPRLAQTLDRQDTKDIFLSLAHPPRRKSSCLVQFLNELKLRLIYFKDRIICAIMPSPI